VVAVALVYNDHPGTQAIAMNLCALAGAAAFYVILAHDQAVRGRGLGEPAAAAAIGGQGRCRVAARHRIAAGREIAGKQPVTRNTKGAARAAPS
jgi:hypothetical protein